ncbi:MAG TPA: Xaa-Pro peptidase family protein [Bordetella sp.]|nr:Xaa-Pro peptidase family protein [Bordetella sp.]
MTPDIPSFDRAEFEGRVARLRAEMRARGAEVMLLDDIEILAYFTGYERSISYYRACLVPLEGEPLMVLRSLDTAPFLETAWFEQHVGYADAQDAVAFLTDEIRARWGAAPRIGVDFGSHGMTVDVFQRLQAALPDAAFVAMTGVPWELRLIKSPAEVRHIERASGIADQTLAEMAARARMGMSGRDLAAYAAGRYIELGALPGHVGPITYGKDWGFLHGHLHDTPMKSGDVLHIELVPRFRGYSARLMRSVVMGQPTAQQYDTVRQLAALQDAQIAAMVPGASARTVDALLRDGVLRAGLRESYENITGYTLGYYSQQPVRSSDFTRVFGPHADWTLEAGMVFHMYTSARGLALSETVLVDRDGPRRLTQLPRKLYSAGE